MKQSSREVERPATRARVYAAHAALAADVEAALSALGTGAEVSVAAEPVARASDGAMDTPIGVVASSPSDAAALPLLALRWGARAVAMVTKAAQGADAQLAGDIGLVLVDTAAGLAAALQLVAHGIARASTAGLPAVDRNRLPAVDRGAEGRLARHGALLVYTRRGRHLSPSIPLGPVEAVAEALVAVAAALSADREPPPLPVFARADASLDVLFGPTRALSGPASKTALAPYGLPFPVEETCSSASAAATAAGRLGFPVRLSLASPDLRVPDHPDLAIDGVRHAAGARDAYRELMLRAELLDPNARVLGATVARSSIVTARLHVRATFHPCGVAAATVGFADEHGRASNDETSLRLPVSATAMRRALGRLRGASLVDGLADPLADALSRLGAFVSDRAREVVGVEVDPVVRLADGRAEVWNARVSVGDVFVRALDA